MKGMFAVMSSPFADVPLAAHAPHSLAPCREEIGPKWVYWPGLCDYQMMLEAMQLHVQAMMADNAPETIWCLEHPPLYSAGTSAKNTDLLRHDLPVYESGRGGQYTYHGPGQRVVYLMLNLKQRQWDVRCYVHNLEAWLIASLAEMGIIAQRRPGRIGVWVTGKDAKPEQEAKIAAIGIRVRRHISLHGIALNVCPDLSAFQGIVPCGLRDFGVTSLAALGVGSGEDVSVQMARIDKILAKKWQALFENHAKNPASCQEQYPLFRP
jgi:lipoyl(octanoyl) transferase